MIPLVAIAFGAGTVIGNIAGGRLVDRMQFKAAGLVLLWSTAVLLAFPFAARTPTGLLVGITAVGTMVALAVVLQTRLMDVAGDAQTLAAASNHAAFNVANALGPWLGGLAIDAGLAVTSTAWIGAGTAATGLALWFTAIVLDRSERTRSADGIERNRTASRPA